MCVDDYLFEWEEHTNYGAYILFRSATTLVKVDVELWQKDIPFDNKVKTDENRGKPCTLIWFVPRESRGQQSLSWAAIS